MIEMKNSFAQKSKPMMTLAINIFSLMEWLFYCFLLDYFPFLEHVLTVVLFLDWFSTQDADKELKFESKDPASNGPEEPEQNGQHDPSDSCNGNGEDHETSAQGDKVTEDAKNEQDQAGTETKVLKKPDKILPCPRCNSMDTKFCYYNNYNVNQPRHFCKNCQRYWTAGGTMRNVPVGAGRRKNKHTASHQHHLMMLSDGMPTNRLDASDLNHSRTLPSGPSTASIPIKVNATLLKFGPEAPLCESMASVLNLGDQKKKSELSSIACGENVDEPSCASSMTVPNGVEKEHPEGATNLRNNSMPGYCTGVNPLHPLPSYPGPPWVYPWSPGWNNVAAMAAGRSSNENGSENGHPNPIPWNPPPMVVAPAFCAPAIPFPFIPPSFWGCMPTWPYGAWNAPWAGSNGGLSPSSSTSNSGCSGNGGSPTLGKHSRDANSQCEEKVEKSLWVPKTLRIDDPDEAAKSSIWATLGIKPDEGGIFKSFKSKSESKGQESDTAQVLHANPAALSRSQTFQEST